MQKDFARSIYTAPLPGAAQGTGSLAHTRAVPGHLRVPSLKIQIMASRQHRAPRRHPEGAVTPVSRLGCRAERLFQGRGEPYKGRSMENSLLVRNKEDLCSTGH